MLKDWQADNVRESVKNETKLSWRQQRPEQHVLENYNREFNYITGTVSRLAEPSELQFYNVML
jgi:hypothetical protein